MKRIKNIALNFLLAGAMLIFACKNKITSPEETPLEVLHGQIHNVAETIRNSEGQHTYPIMLEFGQLRLLAFLQERHPTEDPLTGPYSPTRLHISPFDDEGKLTGNPIVIVESEVIANSYRFMSTSTLPTFGYVTSGEGRNDVRMKQLYLWGPITNESSPTESLDDQTMEKLTFQDIDGRGLKYIVGMIKDEGANKNAYALKGMYNNFINSWLSFELINVSKNASGITTDQCAVVNFWNEEEYIMYTQSGNGKDVLSFNTFEEAGNVASGPIKITSESEGTIKDLQLFHLYSKVGYTFTLKKNGRSDIYAGLINHGLLLLNPVKISGNGYNCNVSLCQIDNDIGIVYQKNNPSGSGSEIVFRKMDNSGNLSKEYLLTDNDNEDIEDFRKVDMQPAAIMMENGLVVSYVSGMWAEQPLETQALMLYIQRDQLSWN